MKRFFTFSITCSILFACSERPNEKNIETSKDKTVEVANEGKTVNTSEESIDRKTSVLQEHQLRYEEALNDYFVTHYVLPNNRAFITESKIEISLSDKIFKGAILISKTDSDWSTGEDVTLEDKIEITGKILQARSNPDNISMMADCEIGVNYQSLSYYGIENHWDMKDVLKEQTFVFPLNKETDNNEDNSLYFVGRTRKLSREELKNYSSDELGYLRNEFYARKGYAFKTDKMKTYFATKEWYAPTQKDVDPSTLVSKTEVENIFLIKAMEEELKLQSGAASSQNIEDVYKIATTRKLTDKDLNTVAIHQLPYLRNMIYAKKGYIFSSARYREYFSKQAWYSPTSSNVDDLLSAIEVENATFIKEYETKNK